MITTRENRAPLGRAARAAESRPDGEPRQLAVSPSRARPPADVENPAPHVRCRDARSGGAEGALDGMP
eukprot:2065314-Prymnesium_polylepis.1